MLLLLLLLLSRFSRVQLCATPKMAAPIPGILQARTVEWVAISFLEVAKNKAFISEKIYATHIALLLLLEELTFFYSCF